MNRRKFIQNTALSGLGLSVGASALANGLPESNSNSEINKENYPLVIATWQAERAVSTAWETLQKGGSALDAIEKGYNVEEEDPTNNSVGFGGRPDRDGHVTLDACIMDAKGNYGSVVFMENIAQAISVARKVMEETPHVLLAGKGAE